MWKAESRNRDGTVWVSCFSFPVFQRFSVLLQVSSVPSGSSPIFPGLTSGGEKTKFLSNPLGNWHLGVLHLPLRQRHIYPQESVQISRFRLAQIIA